MSFTIRGDILDGSWSHIVQQCNCLTVFPRGLAKDIGDKYPYANIYSYRKQLGNSNLATEETRSIPGTVLVAEPSKNANGPIVFNFMTQYDMSKPLRYNRTSDKIVDSSENREKWFEGCLAAMESSAIEKYNIKVLAFPDHIGCGLAGGNWEQYKTMIDNFSERIHLRGIAVCIVLNR